MDFNADVCRAAIGNQRNAIAICLADGVAMLVQAASRISRFMRRCFPDAATPSRSQLCILACLGLRGDVELTSDRLPRSALCGRLAATLTTLHLLPAT